jgi:hypothetical protein
LQFTDEYQNNNNKKMEKSIDNFFFNFLFANL